MPRPRCPECHRLTIGMEFTVADVDALKPHIVTLLKLGREFIEQTPEGEQYDIIDFLDSIALTWGINGAGVKYAKPAGRPAARRPSKAA